MKKLKNLTSFILLLSILPATFISAATSKSRAQETQVKSGSSKAVVKSKPEPHYPKEARKQRIEPTIVLRAVLSSTGKVTGIKFEKAIPNNLPEDILKLFTDESIKAAEKIKFKPATKDGHPASTYVQLEYNFHPW